MAEKGGSNGDDSGLETQRAAAALVHLQKLADWQGDYRASSAVREADPDR